MIGGVEFYMYTKTICKINNKIEVTKHYPVGKSINRDERTNKTPEEMAKQNAWIRARDLRRTMELNFKGGDLHVTLTCSPDKRPTMETAMKVIRKFRDKLRCAYKKQNWTLKYIITTELGERGAVHWHMVVNNLTNENTSTSKLIHGLWDRGRPYMTLMDNNREYKKLAEYIIKETSKRIEAGKTLEKLSYISSRNLIRPVVETEKIRSNSWRKNPKAEKGWYVEENSLLNKNNKYTGLPYQHYTLRKFAEKGGNGSNG